MQEISDTWWLLLTLQPCQGPLAVPERPKQSIVSAGGNHLTNLMSSCCAWVTLSVGTPGGFRILVGRARNLSAERCHQYWKQGPGLTNLHELLPPSVSFYMSKCVGTAVLTLQPAIHNPTVVVPTRSLPHRAVPDRVFQAAKCHELKERHPRVLESARDQRHMVAPPHFATMPRSSCRA